uniref:Theileria-specific sub-telomeric protein, putative n=1 Tax=Theileria annulata TaxID=5874 RepID=A0A3B0MH06_THEAN
MGCSCKETTVGSFMDDCPYLTAAYIFGGLSMMLNIRLAYSSAPYALIRFKLPENLFSVFVRRMASALELWCLPSMLLGNIVDVAMKSSAKSKEEFNLDHSQPTQNDSENTKLGKLILMKRWKYIWIIYPSILTMWSDFITYLILLIVYVIGDQGNVTGYYAVIAISGFIFGINMTLLYAADWRYIPVYIAGENSFPMLTSIMHYFTTLIFGNRRKWNSDFLIVTIDICVAIIISLVTAILWTYSYLSNHGKDNANKFKFNTNAAYDAYGTAGAKTGTARDIGGNHADKIKEGAGGDAYLATEDGFQKYWHLLPPNNYTGTSFPYPTSIVPALMIMIGMGFVYCIYPGIAPGMIVPFYLVDKIETVLLVLTTFPPVIIAILQKYQAEWSPKFNDAGTFKEWTEYPAGQVCIGLSILMVIKLSLLGMFIYCLHYRDSHISRSIVNQPKMSTFLSIVFYMCHEILLALGFSGFIGNNGGDFILIPQWIGALLMIFLAFYSEGYIIEYKSHDPSHWPTEGMTKWNAFCYWCKRASKITHHNLASLFKICLFRG